MDSVYINSVLNGSTEDFRFLIRKYKDPAFSVAVAIVKDEFEAEEVVQEAFIKAFQHLKSFRGDSNFKTWFYRIVINEAFKRQEKKRREMVLPSVQELPDVEEITDTFRGLNTEEQKMVVTESLKKIAPKESLILQLFYLESNSLEEITNLTGWSQSNVKVLLHRGRKHLLEVVNVLMEREYKIMTK